MAILFTLFLLACLVMQSQLTPIYANPNPNHKPDRSTGIGAYYNSLYVCTVECLPPSQINMLFLHIKSKQTSAKLN